MKNIKRHIAILIAVKNPGDGLIKTLNSISAQTSSLFKVYLFNGGDISNINDNVLQSNLNFAVYKTWIDSGLANAWNRGLSEVNEDWILLLNAGDLLHCKFVDTVTKKIQNSNESTILMADVNMFESGQIIKHIRAQKPSIRSIGKGGVGFAHPGTLVHRNVYESIGKFNENLKIGFDSEWILRAWSGLFEFDRHNGIVYMEKGGMSDKYFNIGIKEFFDSVGKLQLPISAFYCKCAPSLFSSLRPFLKLFRVVVRPYLRDIKHYSISLFNLLLSFLPFSIFRRFYLRCLGFDVSRNVSIGFGFNFYTLGNISFGSNVVVNRNVLIDNRAKVTIENNVSIARDVSIFTAGHDIYSPFLEMKKAEVRIKKNVFIFSNSLIMPGVTLGENSIVYPGSVVTKNVPPNSIVGGNPAKFIKLVNIERHDINNYDFPAAM
jgi:acetyltransferase-like isoleucine patch superfamily enzyme